MTKDFKPKFRFQNLLIIVIRLHWITSDDVTADLNIVNVVIIWQLDQNYLISPSRVLLAQTNQRAQTHQ
jgi:hypothetical protein